MAYPFRAILSPIELDDPSSPALGLARSIAKDHGATLHMLYVVAMASAFGEPAISAKLHRFQRGCHTAELVERNGE